MNFREAMRRLALVVAAVTALGGISIGISMLPSRNSIAGIFLYSIASVDADEMKHTASETLRVYRAKLGSTDDEVLQRICASTDTHPQHLETCNRYEAAHDGYWKTIALHIFWTLVGAIGAAAVVMLLWKIFDWVVAGFSVNR